MGTQFFWFYDVLLVAVFLAFTYTCTRKGFASGVVNFVGTLLGFTLALFISAPAASQIYDSFVSPNVVAQITYTAERNLPENAARTAFDTLRSTDMSSAFVNDVLLHDFLRDNRAVEGETMKLNLMGVNLESTGIADGDLAFFGLDTQFDFRFIDVGYIDISAAERASYELDDIILARIISYCISDKAAAKHDLLTKNLIDTLPGVTRVSRGTVDLVGNFLLVGMQHDTENIASLVDTHMVRPVTIVPFRMLVFGIIFATISIVVSAVAKAQDFAERFTLVERVNKTLGFFMGVAFSVVVAAVFVVSVSIIVAMTGDTVIFLNTMTIAKTYIFKHLYGLEFLNFEIM
ncbi:MAG: hypothetical protein FWD35_00095 [Oscillospiraceae bacterium]|nr:hypothetical protein [Oscillospiraceae bacterium]